MPTVRSESGIRPATASAHATTSAISKGMAVCIASRGLEDSGVEVRCAEDGCAAVWLLQAGLSDALTCDLDMPRMSGFEFLSIVRRRSPQSPVVVSSGEFFEPDTADALLADAF